MPHSLVVEVLRPWTTGPRTPSTAIPRRPLLSTRSTNQRGVSSASASSTSIEERVGTLDEIDSIGVSLAPYHRVAQIEFPTEEAFDSPQLHW